LATATDVPAGEERSEQRVHAQPSVSPPRHAETVRLPAASDAPRSPHSGHAQVTQAAARRFDRPVEAEVLRQLVAHVEFVEIVAVDHRRRGAAFVSDTLDVLAREDAQRDVPAPQRLRGHLRQEGHLWVSRRGDSPARLDVADEVVLLLERVVAVGCGSRNDEVVVADRVALSD
jgi:hypothetical protein